MWRSIHSRMLMDEEKGGEGAGGGGGAPAGEGDKDTGGESEAEKTAQRLKEIEDSNKALDAKRQELLDENKKLKKQYEGLPEPEKIRELFKKVENNEEMKLLSEGKTDEVIQRRTERIKAEYDSKIDNLSSENKTYQEKLQQSEAIIQELMIDNNAVTSFLKNGGLDGASEDVKLRASRVFKVEDGQAIPRDEKGEIIRGKNGPMTWDEWVKDLAEKAPHLFEGSAGANAAGNRGGKGNTLQDKLVAARKDGNVTEVRRLKEQIRKQQAEA